jgi:hypothetical protein
LAVGEVWGAWRRSQVCWHCREFCAKVFAGFEVAWWAKVVAAGEKLG